MNEYLRKSDEMNLSLVIISGVTGPSVYLCGYRIAGEKPWGGGTVIADWTIKMTDIREALSHGRRLRKNQKDR